MTPPNVTPSPKQRFLAIKHCVDAHRELIQRQDLQLALDSAMAQMMWVQSNGGEPAAHVDGNTAASRFYRLQGAQEFVRTLKTLAEIPQVLPAQESELAMHQTFK